MLSLKVPLEVSPMKEIRDEQKTMIEKAKASPGVEELMKVYERFQEANAITNEYLRLVSPTSFQTNSNKSLLE